MGSQRVRHDWAPEMNWTLTDPIRKEGFWYRIYLPYLGKSQRSRERGGRFILLCKLVCFLFSQTCESTGKQGLHPHFLVLSGHSVHVYWKDNAWFPQEQPGRNILFSLKFFSKTSMSYQKCWVTTQNYLGNPLDCSSPSLCRWDFHCGPKRTTKKGWHLCNQLPIQARHTQRLQPPTKSL